jgi:hypothetical protein
VEDGPAEAADTLVVEVVTQAVEAATILKADRMGARIPRAIEIEPNLQTTLPSSTRYSSSFR